MAEDKKTEGMRENSWSSVISRFGNLASQYQGLPQESIYAAFSRAGWGLANQPQVQNARIKGISSLPCDYTKEDLGMFLRDPYNSEIPLRQTSEILKYTAYPYAKLIKMEADIPTYRYYALPSELTEEQAQSKDFKRETSLVDAFNRELRPDKWAHEIAGKAHTFGKVAYCPRYEVDKIHGKVNYAFLQQLPTDWTVLIGYNNVSGYTVSFNMMYFLQPGTDYRQFGDLFVPYLSGFRRIFEPPKGEKYVYSSAPSVEQKNGNRVNIYPENIDRESEGNPRLFLQNGTWMYWVSLPIDKVFVFEIDDTSPATVPFMAGLMLTYSQESDFEQAQLSNVINPLLMFLTGEIDYFSDDGARVEDSYRLSNGGRKLFEVLFDQMLSRTNTSGVGWYTAPVKNIKSHTFPESANANNIASSYNAYASGKSGTSALIPVDDDIKAAQVRASELIEGRFTTATIYAQMENMMNRIYRSLRLRFDWRFRMFGTIFTEEDIQKRAEARISRGDLLGYVEMAALSGLSLSEWVAGMRMARSMKLTDLLEVPQTAYTQSKNSSGGRPETDDMSDAKEKSIDAGESGE